MISNFEPMFLVDGKNLYMTPRCIKKYLGPNKIYIPHQIATGTRPAPAMREDKLHPSIDISTFKEIQKTKTHVVLQPEMPLDNNPARYCKILVDLKAKTAAVLVKQSLFSNHNESRYKVGPVEVQCTETAFVLARQGVVYEEATNDEDRAHVCEITELSLVAESPFKSNSVTRGLRAGLFNKDIWDPVAEHHMTAALLLQYSQDPEAFNRARDLKKMLVERYEVEHVAIAEVGTDNLTWQTGAGGDDTLAALMELEELTNESAETVFKRLGGQNKFGRAYSVLWEAVEDYDTIEAFRAVVNYEIGPIVEIEEKVAEPEAKRARV